MEGEGRGVEVGGLEGGTDLEGFEGGGVVEFHAGEVSGGVVVDAGWGAAYLIWWQRLKRACTAEVQIAAQQCYGGNWTS